MYIASKKILAFCVATSLLLQNSMFLAHATDAESEHSSSTMIASEESNNSFEVSTSTTVTEPTSQTTTTTELSTQELTTATTTSEAATTTESNDPVENLATLSTFFGEKITSNYTINEKKKEIIPLEIVSDGDVTLTITYPKLNTDYTMKVYNNDAFITVIQAALLDRDSTSQTVTITVGSSQTLYLVFEPAEAVKESQLTSYSFSLTALLKDFSIQTVSSKMTLKNNTKTTKKAINSKSKHYYKLSIKKNCYFYLGTTSRRIKIKLLDKSKKIALSPTISLKPSNNFQASFALSKGTYYALITADYQTNYQLYYHSTNVPDKSGHTIKKAKNISLGTQNVNVISSTMKAEEGQFYKFKIGSKRKLQIAFYVENCGSQFQLELYDQNKQRLACGPYPLGNASLLYINSVAVMPKGTYYIKVSKKIEKTSGCYSVLVRTQ